jgi:hypothetical protein
MEPLLTLVIALGGIATGIGAIWTAVVTRHLARATEQSVAEQSQSLREQKERARLTLEYDLLSRLADRLVMPHFLSLRRAAAKHLLDNAFVEDDTVEAPPLDIYTQYVCDYYEEVGEMLRVGVLRPEPVWSRFGYMAQAYWLLCKPAIEKMREEWQTLALYEEFEYLSRVCADLDRKRGVAAHSQERLRQIMEDEVVIIAEEPPTTPE